MEQEFPTRSQLAGLFAISIGTAFGTVAGFAYVVHLFI